MPNQFYKGRTNNHLTWVMVDATDFATPESALSAAIKIKIYGHLRGGTGTNLVSSGTGSLTNDIQHVGASALGIYHIALAKADLSDASAAWYDQYVVSLSATGAAYQVIVVDGGIDLSAISGYQSRLSDIASAVLVVQSMASDAASAATQANSRVLLTQSLASDAASAAAQANSRVLLVQSRLSDFDSRLVSDISDLASQMLLATSAASDAYSAILIVQSRLSDLDSRLVSDVSDIRSAIAAITVTISASDVSDIASAVVAGLPITSAISDIYSLLSDFNSDFQSRVPKRVATDSQLSDLASDVKSAVVVVQSMASDAASAAQQANSRVLLNQSRISDIQSYLVVMSAVQSDIYSLASDLQSDFQSRVPKAVATNSQLSDLHSDLRSFATANQSQVSDIYSLLSDVNSQFGAAVTDSIPADGSLPNIKQALYMVVQYLNERSVSGTTVTVKKADGSTTLYTLTVNDGTSPTSITRTT